MNRDTLEAIVAKYPGFKYATHSYYGKCPFLVYMGDLPRISEFDALLIAQDDGHGANYWHTFVTAPDTDATITDYSRCDGKPNYRVNFPWKQGAGWVSWGFEHLPAYEGNYSTTLG